MSEEQQTAMSEADVPEATAADAADVVDQAALDPTLIRPITFVGEPVLHRRCADVTDFGPEFQELLAQMFTTMYAANGVGLAANQIGVDARVFVYDCPDASGKNQRGVVVNPEFVDLGLGLDERELDDDFEGCLSVPGQNAKLARPNRAAVTGQDAHGAPIRVDGDGLLARCLQHETDHLNGTLYIDRLRRKEKKRVLQELSEDFEAGYVPEDWPVGGTKLGMFQSE